MKTKHWIFIGLGAAVLGVGAFFLIKKMKNKSPEILEDEVLEETIGETNIGETANLKPNESTNAISPDKKILR